MGNRLDEDRIALLSSFPCCFSSCFTGKIIGKGLSKSGADLKYKTDCDGVRSMNTASNPKQNK
jgi:hypothetical protein